MMRPDIKARWTSKLREPDRRQAQGFLEIKDVGQCCLGVLCEIAVEDGVIGPPDWSEISPKSIDSPIAGSYRHEFGVLPYEVVTWAGLENTNPSVMCSGTRSVLSECNDNGLTFPEIADLIDEQL